MCIGIVFHPTNLVLSIRQTPVLLTARAADGSCPGFRIITKYFSECLNFFRTLVLGYHTAVRGVSSPRRRTRKINMRQNSLKDLFCISNDCTLIQIKKKMSTLSSIIYEKKIISNSYEIIEMSKTNNKHR